MSGSSYNIGEGVHNNVTFTNLIAPDNTKGTLMINDGVDVGFLSVGTNGQFVTANSSATLGVDWQDKPTGTGTNSISYLIAGIRSEDATTNYSTYAYPSAINAWGSTFCEGIPFPFSGLKIVKTTIRPAEDVTWGSIPVSDDFIIALGTLTGGGDIGTDGTFTAYSGTGVTVTVDNTYANTRTPIVTTCDISIASEDAVAVRCINTVGYDLDISVFIFIRGAITS